MSNLYTDRDAHFFNAGVEMAARLFETQQQTFKTDADEALLSFRVMAVLAESIRALKATQDSCTKCSYANGLHAKWCEKAQVTQELPVDCDHKVLEKHGLRLWCPGCGRYPGETAQQDTSEISPELRAALLEQIRKEEEARFEELAKRCMHSHTGLVCQICFSRDEKAHEVVNPVDCQSSGECDEPGKCVRHTQEDNNGKG